jgi:hypothetical protein
MAPDAPLWEIALVSAGSGLIAVSMRQLSNRPSLKLVVDFVMFTILLWMILMTADIIVAAMRHTLLSSPDRPMWSLLGIAAILTLTGQFLSARRKSQRNSGAIMERKLPAPKHSPMPKSRAALPYAQQKRLARR